MYSSFINQFSNLSRYIFTFALVFLILPRFLFTRKKESLTESTVSNFIMMTLLLIITGYVLVIIKLFELISIAIILIILFFRRYLANKSVSGFEEITDAMNIWMFNTADGLIHPWRSVINWFENKRHTAARVLADNTSGIQAIANTLLFFSVFIYSSWLRFHDAVLHAAPALSDAYTTLAWMKHIDKRILFYEDGGGIYPRGFHIILDTLYKFSAIDPLYILRYSGPLIGIMITAGLYFTVSRITGRTFPGILAALDYGVLGRYLPMEWERQASTNSQEFAFIFIIPVIYFFFLYMKDSKNEDFVTAASGLTVIGLVHQLAFAFTAMGIGIVVAASILTGLKNSWKNTWKTCLSGVAAALISVIPLGIGKLMGIETHGSSVEFLQSISAINMPSLSELSFRDTAVLGCLSMVMLLILVNLLFRKKATDRLYADIFIFLLGIGAFSLYFWGGAFTRSTMIASRSGEFWSLVIPCCIGLGWHALTELITLLRKLRVLEVVLCLGLVVCIAYAVRPLPITPYKMHHDANIEQYLRISSTYRPKTWWLVTSQYEDYAIVDGSGFHTFTSVFLEKYQPQGNTLTLRDTAKVDEELPADIFIYFEKNIFMVDKSNSIYPLQQPEYERREKEKAELQKWIEEYEKYHDNISVFYEDENLRVYHIRVPKDKEKQFRDIWG